MRFTESHEWITLKDCVGTVGITDYAQKELGEIVYIELPKVGDKVKAGQPIARMIDDDARISRDRARARLAVAEAEVDLAAAELRISEASYEAAIEVTAACDAARARHTGRVAAAAEAAAAPSVPESDAG